MIVKPRAGSSSPDVRTVLMRGLWFAGLPPALRQDLIERGQLRRFKRGAPVYRQGDLPRGLWAVVEGELSFSKVGRSGSEVVYHVGGPGMWFGVLGTLTGLPLGLAVSANSELTLLHVPRKAVQEIVAADPQHVLRLVRLPLARAIDLLDLVEHVVRPSPRSRVAARLLLMERLEAEHDDAAAGMPLRLSQSQLAAMTALSRQSVSRVLHELAEAGAIAVGFRQVAVTDAARLQEIADAPE